MQYHQKPELKVVTISILATLLQSSYDVFLSIVTVLIHIQGFPNNINATETQLGLHLKFSLGHQTWENRSLMCLNLRQFLFAVSIGIKATCKGSSIIKTKSFCAQCICSGLGWMASI